MDDTGYHYILDVRVRDANVLRSGSRLRSIFESVLTDFKILKFDEHVFSTGGEGITGYFLLSESHCAYHTYPESRYIAIDVFTCGRDPEPAIFRVAELLGAEEKAVRFLRRGSIAICNNVAVTSRSETAWA